MGLPLVPIGPPCVVQEVYTGPGPMSTLVLSLEAPYPSHLRVSGPGMLELELLHVDALGVPSGPQAPPVPLPLHVVNVPVKERLEIRGLDDAQKQRDDRLSGVEGNPNVPKEHLESVLHRRGQIATERIQCHSLRQSNDTGPRLQ